MLDYKKTGKFICEERQKRNITQEELGDQLYVTRQAVSKWERGKCMPDYDSLLRLGEIFSLSLNEIIAGERVKKNNQSKMNAIFIDTLKAKDKKRLFLLFVFSILLFTLLFFFFTYYFIFTYNTFRVFKFSGKSDHYFINDILGVFSNENSYLKLNAPISFQNEAYDFIEVYYIKDNEKTILCKTNNSSILLNEMNNYQEYFDYKRIDDFLNNLYISIHIKEKEEIIKLQPEELYANNHLIFKKEKKGADSLLEEEKKIETPEKIQKEFKINEQNRFILKKQNKSMTYEPNLGVFILEETNKKVRELWFYTHTLNTIAYYKYKNNQLIETSELEENNILCTSSSCKDHEKRYNYFINKYINYYFK